MWFGYLLCLLVVCCGFWLFGYGGGFCLVFWGCLLCLCSGLLVCLLFIVNSVGTALYIYAFLMFVSCSVGSGCYVCACGLGGLLL